MRNHVEIYVYENKNKSLQSLALSFRFSQTISVYFDAQVWDFHL